MHDIPPGSFPLTKRRVKKENFIVKLRTYFHSENQVSIKTKEKESRWNNFWKRKSKPIEIKNTVNIGTAVSLSVPITISNTTHSQSNNSLTTKQTTSTIQQLVILPPLQVYGFMFIITLFLLVIAFAILQVHRTISIIELAVQGIQHILINFSSLFSFLLGLK